MLNIQSLNVPIVRALSFPAFSFLCGAVISLSMAPLHILPALFLGFSGFYLCLHHVPTHRLAAVCGFFFGFGYFLFGLEWVANALLVEGNSFAWAWPLAVCGLPAALGVFYGVTAYFIHRFYSLDKFLGFLGFCALFAMADWLRGHMFTGFPWNLFAYSWGEILEILQILSLGNVYFLNILSICWASALGFLFIAKYKKNQKALIGSCIFLIFIGCYGFGALRLQKNPTTYLENQHIRIVQPNIDQHTKWQRDKMQGHYISNLSLSLPSSEDKLSPADSTLVIWPETASSSYIIDQADNKGLLSSTLKKYEGEAYLLTGLLKYTSREDFSNAAALYNQEGEEIALYKKTKLVPFGEFIPFQKWIPISTVTGFQGFSRGNGPPVERLPTGLSYTPLVCYEIIFPGLIGKEVRNNTDILVNVTNDAWYGQSAGPYQHLLHARYRAIETGIPVIRSANTGISALFDPAGRILYNSDLFMKDSASVKVPKKLDIFTKSSLGEGILFIFLIISMAIGGTNLWYMLRGYTPNGN